MRTIVVYKEMSDHARSVYDFTREFESRTGIEVEEMNPESIEGEAFCRTYDVVEYPTLLVTTDDGVVMNSWQGLPLPTVDNVRGYSER